MDSQSNEITLYQGSVPEQHLISYCLPTDITREISAFCSYKLAVIFSLTSKSIRHDINSSTRDICPGDQLKSVSAVEQFASFRRLYLSTGHWKRTHPIKWSTIKWSILKFIITRSPVEELDLSIRSQERILRQMISSAELQSWTQNLSKLRSLKLNTPEPFVLDFCLTCNLRVLQLSDVLEINSLVDRLTAQCPNLQCLQLQLKDPTLTGHDWLVIMHKLSVLRSLCYASVPRATHLGPPLDFSKFNFIADTENLAIFKENPRGFMLMLERTVKKFGLATVLEFVPLRRFLQEMNTPQRLLPFLQAGLDASTVLDMSWLFLNVAPVPSPEYCPVWLFVIVMESQRDSSTMINFMRYAKVVRHPASGELCSVLDQMIYRYRCLPSSSMIWSFIWMCLKHLNPYSAWIDSVTAFLLDVKAFPSADIVTSVFSLLLNSCRDLRRRLLQCQECPLPNITLGPTSVSNVVEFIKDVHSDDLEGQKHHGQLLSWTLEHASIATFASPIWTDIMTYLRSLHKEFQFATQEMLSFLIQWSSSQLRPAEMYTLRDDEIMTSLLSRLPDETLHMLEGTLNASGLDLFIVLLILAGLPRCVKLYISRFGADNVNAKLEQRAAAFGRTFVSPLPRDLASVESLPAICQDGIQLASNLGVHIDLVFKRQ